jgi:hypothetical protein
MASDDKKTRIVCECKELDEDGNVLRTFPMSSTSENLKRQRRGVSTWNEQLKTVAALMNEVLAGEKAESGLQLKIAGKLKKMGRIENPTRENVRQAIEEIRGGKSMPRPGENTPPKREPIELEEDSDSDSEQPKVIANNSRGIDRMQKQGGGGCGCTGGADTMMMKGGAGCGMLPLAGGKRKSRRAGGKGRKSRKVSRKSRKGSRKSRKTTRKSRTSRK